MARPRSIGGLLVQLVVLHARRRPGWCVVLACVMLAVVWPSGDGEPVRADLQVGVLRDGFVVTYTTDAGRRVVELDVQGQARRTMVLRAGDHRIVGTSIGTAAGWLDNRKVRLARVEDGEDMGTWGKSARQLCDGVASNDARFGVAWLEADDSVWVVHGPVSASTALRGEPSLAGPELAHTDWCGVASAQDNVALIWRTGDRLLFAMCSNKRCSALPARFGLDRRLPVLGFGCLRTSCLVATRDANGNARLALLTHLSRTKWTRPLETSSTVSIVGVGDHAFALGYVTNDGTEVVRVDSEGQITPLWRDPASSGAPALAWSSGRLLIARHRGDAVAHDLIALPR